MKKRKKKKGLSFGSSYRKSNQSKNLQSLPSSLSSYSWIENTNKNLALLEQEKLKIANEKR
jgi:hypothetical protein